MKPNRDISNHMAFVRQLNKELCEKLSGDETERLHDVFERNPDEKYYIGQLYPLQTANERYATISQISVEFNIKAAELDTASLRIMPQGSFFYRVFPTLEEQRTTVMRGLNYDTGYEYKWQRSENENYGLPISVIYEKLKLDESFVFDVKLSDIYEEKDGASLLTIDDEFDARIDSKLDEIYKRNDIYRIVRDSLEMDYLQNNESFERFLSVQTDNIPVKPVWSLNLKITLRKLGSDTINITISLLNNTNVSEFDISMDKSQRSGRNLKSYSNRLFNANLKIELTGGEIQAVKQDYFIDDYKYDNRQMAVGHNCAIAFSDKSIIQTTHIPCYVQKRLKTRDDLAVRFEDLVSAPVETLKNMAFSLRKELDEWRKDYKLLPESYSERAKGRFKTELDNTEKEITRFEYGIALLEKYAPALESFVLTNRTFMECSKHYESWRIFQIVFVVSLIPDILVQEYGEHEINKSEINSADVLYFPAGGGKTEAFLAVTVFSLFFDRLRGKHEGVTAIIKYPLRLLSAQQVSRVCDILASAEIIRRSTEKIKDAGVFSVGYFAGEINTPNSLSETLINEIEGLSQSEADLKYRLLETCPFCKSETHIKVNHSKIVLEHVCSNPDCLSGGTLPLYIVDREIYRYLPSVIISTLDKMAAIGYQSNFRNILGRVLKKCPQHGFTSKLVCTEDRLCGVDPAYFKDADLYDSAPGLVICDEMHLSREALGTFASHYESVFQYMISKFSNNKLKSKKIKYIGASATISGYEEQMYHLFGKKSVLFPADSPYADKNLYSYVDHDEDNRVLIGFMPYGKASLNALAYSLLYLREILCKYKDNPQLMYGISGMDLYSEDEALQIVQDYWLLLNYNNRKLDCNIVIGALEGPINIELNKMGLPPYETRKITGDDSFGSVKSLIQEIDGCTDMFGLFNIVISTSMISHGVDTDKFNIMTFFGTPSSTAEYVQAYSRSGRVYPSYVLSIMRTKNEKDISNLKYFEGFHKYKNLMIDAVPIDRWAEKSIVKTFPGILSAFLINHYDLELQGKYGGLYMMDALQNAMKNGSINKNELLNHILSVYGCSDIEAQVAFPAGQFKNYIISQFNAFGEDIININCDNLYITEGFAKLGLVVMNSLRDTEQSLKVVLS